MINSLEKQNTCCKLTVGEKPFHNTSRVSIMMKKMVLVILVLSFVQACTSKEQTLKSPCVGAAGSPCGDRVPVNEHWLKTLHS